MPRKTQTKPRKHATQERSRVTVDALVEATARILVRDGFDKASTNRIAEEAGVSVGSLYQYFPGKEALVIEVIDRHNQEIMQLVRPALVEVMAQPVEKAVRMVVEVAVAAHRIAPELHRAIAEQLPRTGNLENLEAFNRDSYAMFLAYLEAHRAEIREVDLGMAAYVCVTSIEALSHNTVLHRAEMLTDEALGMLIDETTRLILGYLKE
jgi:AcrR family transcriptional regulator